MEATLRVLVCGSRDWNDIDTIYATLDGLYLQATMGHLSVEISEFVLIEGGAPGADSIAAQWAKNSPTHSYNEKPDDPHFEHLQFRADWRKYGKAAGPLRNQQMLDEGKPDVVRAFKNNFDWVWLDSNGKQWKHLYHGTEDMVRRARAATIPCYVVSRA